MNFAKDIELLQDLCLRPLVALATVDRGDFDLLLETPWSPVLVWVRDAVDEALAVTPILYLCSDGSFQIRGGQLECRDEVCHTICSLERD